MNQNIDDPQNEIDNPEYSEGFDNGFIIAKHKPSMSDMFLPALNKCKTDEIGDYLSGLRYGMLVYELEKIREEHPLNKTSQDKEKDIDIEPSKD